MSTSPTLNRQDAFGSILGKLGDANKGVRQILLEDIKKSSAQPRTYFDETAHAELVESIKKHGVIQPILAREIPNGYELVAGERRVRASRDAGLESIPALVKNLSDEQVQEIALEENLQREDLNPVEETDGILSLIAFRLNINNEDVIEAIRTLHYLERGRTVNTHVDSHRETLIKETLNQFGHTSCTAFYNNRLPILKLPQDLLQKVREGVLEYPKATTLARIADETTRKNMTEKVINEGLTRTQISQEIKSLTAKSPLPPNSTLLSTKKLLTKGNLKKLSQEQEEKVNDLLKELHQILSNI
jgi:ParB family transcriptional regulator, chromosome partitioning protein